MKFIIDCNKGAGLLELILLIPIFLGVVCMVYGLGIFLIQKTSLEKYAWTRQTQLTYGRTVQMAAGVEESSSPNPHSFGLQGSIPHTFQSFLIMNPSKNYSLVMKVFVSPILTILHSASFHSGDSNSKKWTTTFVVPGASLKKNIVFKNELWSENMRNAGFDYPLLQQVGLKEIKNAAIPWNRLGNVLSSEETKWIKTLD